MNVIMFAARESQLLLKAAIDQKGLEELRRDVKSQFAITVKEAYLTYDAQGGITVTLVMPEHDGRNN